MAKISDLESLARPYIRDCPKLLVARELLRAARKFCQESQVWQETYHIGFAAGLSEGQINMKDGQAMQAIIDVRKMGGTESLIKTPSPRFLQTASGEPRAYAATTSRLYIGPLPTDTYIAEALIAVKPSLSATTLPDDFLEDWGEAVAHGAVESLLNMPDTDWYDPKASMGHGNQFRNGITDARVRMSQGFSNASPRASGGRFI